VISSPCILIFSMLIVGLPKLRVQATIYSTHTFFCSLTHYAAPAVVFGGGALIGAAILRLALPLHGTAPVVATTIGGVGLPLGLYALASAVLQTKY